MSDARDTPDRLFDSVTITEGGRYDPPMVLRFKRGNDSRSIGLTARDFGLLCDEVERVKRLGAREPGEWER